MKIPYFDRIGISWKISIEARKKTMTLQYGRTPASPENPPAFNVPRVILVLVVILIAIHLVRQVLSPAADFWVILAFAFVPARYATHLSPSLPGGVAADFWSFLTYAGLHGDGMHLTINCLWLTAFGSPVARRFGWQRFLLLSAIATIGGAAAHLVARWGDFVPVVGASAAISGHMGAAIRFVFAAPGLQAIGGGADIAMRLPALPLRDVLRNERVLAFLGVWFALNLLFGLGSVALPGMESVSVAWEAHIGGFIAGLLAFRWLDPIPRRPFRIVSNSE